MTQREYGNLNFSEGVQTDVDDRLRGLLSLFQVYGFDGTVTSGKRGVSTNQNSLHPRGKAIDVQDASGGQDKESLVKLLRNPVIKDYMVRHGIRVFDEYKRNSQDKTGQHLHFEVRDPRDNQFNDDYDTDTSEVLGVDKEVVTSYPGESVVMSYNNPLNIRKTGDEWVGSRLNDSYESNFVQFSTPEFGYRAAFKNMDTLLSRMSEAGEELSVENLVAKWAPKDENDLDAYFGNLKNMGIEKDAKVDLDDPVFAMKLAGAMTRIEKGQDVDERMIGAGYNMYQYEKNGTNDAYAYDGQAESAPGTHGYAPEGWVEPEPTEIPYRSIGAINPQMASQFVSDVMSKTDYNSNKEKAVLQNIQSNLVQRAQDRAIRSKFVSEMFS